VDAPQTLKRPTELLMVSHYFEEHRGGVEIVADALARELTSRGFHVARLGCGPLSRADVERRGRIIKVGATNVLEEVLSLPYPIPYPWTYHTIWAEAKRADVVLVHDGFYLTSIVSYFAARFYRKPFLIVQHIGMVPYQNPILRGVIGAAHRFVTSPILRRAEQAIFVSQLTFQQFANLRFRRAPVFIFNGVDTHIFFPAANQAEIASTRRSLGLPLDVPIALFVGRFIEKKGMAVLERMARARADILFVFAGWGSVDPAAWDLPNARIYRSASGRALASLYRASNLLLLPSVGEGFPLVVQEALACGLPIICGSDTAHADSRAAPLVKGVRVDLQDPDRTAQSFLEEMTRALAQPETEADRSKRSEFAKAHYSWAGAAADYIRILKQFAPTPSDELVPTDLINGAMTR
jgi:glycosyltransferase involved in cell wall biosynthesis